MSHFLFELLSSHIAFVYSYGCTLLFHFCSHHIKLQTSHSDTLNWLNSKQGITKPSLNPKADWSFPLTLYPPARLTEFLSIKAERDLLQQGGALQPAETDNGRSILLRQIPGSTIATYFPNGYLLPWGALWVQHRGNMFHQVSANLCQLTLLYSSNNVLASLPASLPVTSPWYYPERKGDTIQPLLLSGMGQRVFPLPSPCLALPLSPGLRRNNPCLVPTQ